MTSEQQRELLKLAAKAAGYVVEDYIDANTAWVYEIDSKPNADGEHPIFKWAPRLDDGDALRLAVKLGLLISQSSYIPGENAYGFVNIAWYGQKVEFKPERFTDDPYTATRLAIVRAAAEIGRGLK